MPTVQIGNEKYALEQADEVTASSHASLTDDEEAKVTQFWFVSGLC